MWLLIAAIIGGGGVFLFGRWRKSLPIDSRLTLSYWRNSAALVGLYLLSILVGAVVTRVMVGFNRSGWADLVMVGFFIAWVAYGAICLLRFLPSTKPRPAWLDRGRYWVDAMALILLAGLATAARLL